MRRIACVLAMAVVAACTTYTGPSLSGLDHELQPMERRAFTHQGVTREYFVFVPPELRDEDVAAPVLFHLHGYTSTATGYQAYHGSNYHAQKAGYIAVYPQGSHFFTGTGEMSQQITSWNDLAGNIELENARRHCPDTLQPAPCPPECDSCTRCAWTSCYDDVGFLKEVATRVDEEFNTDPSRRYLLGVSNGAMMALRMGCARSKLFGAVVAVIGQLAPGHGCAPSSDLPLLHVAGGRDNAVRPDGGLGSGYYYESVSDTVNIWADAMDCAAPTPLRHPIANSHALDCSSRQNCRTGNQEVVSCIDPTEGHRFPGQRVTGVPATCVTAEQQASMPAIDLCPAPIGRTYTDWGLDFAWDFLQHYHR